MISIDAISKATNSILRRAIASSLSAIAVGVLAQFAFRIHARLCGRPGPRGVSALESWREQSG